MLDIKIPNFSPYDNLGGLIDALIQLAFFGAGLFFFVNVVIAGLQWINAGGDPKSLQGARDRITSSVIGLIIVVAAYAIAAIMQNLLGISIVSGFRFD